MCCAGSDSGIPKGPVTFTILHSKTVWYLDLIISFWFFGELNVRSSVLFKPFLKNDKKQSWVIETSSQIFHNNEKNVFTNLPLSNAKTSHLTQNYRTTHESYEWFWGFWGLCTASYCVGNLPHPQRQDRSPAPTLSRWVSPYASMPSCQQDGTH